MSATFVTANNSSLPAHTTDTLTAFMTGGATAKRIALIYIKCPGSVGTISATCNGNSMTALESQWTDPNGNKGNVFYLASDAQVNAGTNDFTIDRTIGGVAQVVGAIYSGVDSVSPIGSASHTLQFNSSPYTVSPTTSVGDVAVGMANGYGGNAGSGGGNSYGFTSGTSEYNQNIDATNDGLVIDKAGTGGATSLTVTASLSVSFDMVGFYLKSLGGGTRGLTTLGVG